MKNFMVSVSILMLASFYCSAGCRSVQLQSGPDKIDVLIGEKLVTSYRYDDSLAKPILYPIHTPSGIRVNRGYPLKKIEGESNDHPHHSGLFFTYDKINGTDYWSNASPPPRIKHIKVLEKSSNRGKARLCTLSHWTNEQGGVLLEEKRDMIFAAGQNEYTIDFCIDLKAAAEKVEFGDTKEGMFAIRLADWLREKGGSGEYLNSQREVSPVNKNIWGKRARWVRLQGRHKGKTVGVTIFNHPESINYPTYWHARPYGLFAANPLGQVVFQKGRDRDNPEAFHLTLEKGQKAHFAFRVQIDESEKTFAELEREFLKYAK